MKVFESAEVGDKVWDAIRGVGVVINIKSTIQCPLIVKFANSKIVSYTLYGKEHLDNLLPTLFWEKQELNYNTKRPEKKWHKDGRIFPCLCWVSDSDKHRKKVVRMVIFYNPERNVFLTSEQDWNYATPLTKEELLEYCLEERMEK